MIVHVNRKNLQRISGIILICLSVTTLGSCGSKNDNDEIMLKVNSLDSDVSRLKSDVSTLENKVRSLESDVSTLESKVRSLESKVRWQQ